MARAEERQYADSANLTRRADLHRAYANVRWFDWLAARLELSPGAEVLDIGCGPGWLWRAAAAAMPPGLRLTLLDASPGMVAEATRALAGAAPYAGAAGVVGDACALPLRAGRFDAAALMHVLYHTGDPGRALAEAARVLRPGGRVLVTLNARDDLREITDIIETVYGGTPMDHAASPIYPDEAERLMAERFDHLRRHLLRDEFACADRQVVIGHIMSMPPANVAGPAASRRLEAAVDAAFAAGGGVLRARKRTALIVGAARPGPT